MTTLKTEINNKYNSSGFCAIANGIDFDKRIFSEEISIQRAWLKAITNIKVFDQIEFRNLDAALRQAEDLHKDKTFPWKISDEDIHMNLERFLTESCGEYAKKIHIGRSRNDLIATTLRLFVKNQARLIQEKLFGLAKAALEKADEFALHIAPAFTHMQAAQPIRMGQIFLSYGFWMERDIHRYSNVAINSMKYMPLGSGAINGTHLDIDLHDLAISLGFESPSYCSYDAVGDRDFLQDFAGTSTVLAGHLSRLCNDIIFLSSTPVSILILPSEWSSGSSIMPNKKNPDLFEIVRAKSARIMAASNELNMILHSIPSGYSSDLHEAKRTISSIIDEIHLCLDPISEAISLLQVNTKKLKEHLNQGHILATDIANSYVASGNTFRDSYKTVARLVAQADREDRQVHELDGKHTFVRAVEGRNNIGGNSLERLKKSIADLRKSLSKSKYRHKDGQLHKLFRRKSKPFRI